MARSRTFHLTPLPGCGCLIDKPARCTKCRVAKAPSGPPLGKETHSPSSDAHSPLRDAHSSTISSNATAAPTCTPRPTTAVMCTNTSGPPSSGVMKLYHCRSGQQRIRPVRDMAHAHEPRPPEPTWLRRGSRDGPPPRPPPASAVI